jgi:hypothetical protein
MEMTGLMPLAKPVPRLENSAAKSRKSAAFAALSPDTVATMLQLVAQT